MCMKTPITNFRLDEETLANLDLIAEAIGQVVNGKPNRAAAIRYAAITVVRAKELKGKRAKGADDEVRC